MRRECHELLAPAEKQGIGAEHEHANMLIDKLCEGGVDLAYRAGIQDMELQPQRGCRLARVSRNRIGIWVVRIYQHGGRRRLLATLSSAAAAGLIGSAKVGAQEAPPETTTVRLTKIPGICVAPRRTQYPY